MKNVKEKKKYELKGGKVATADEGYATNLRREIYSICAAPLAALIY